MTKVFTRMYGGKSHDKYGAVNYPQEIFTDEDLSDINTEMEDNSFKVIGQKDVIDNKLWLFVEFMDGEYGVEDTDVAGIELKLLIKPKSEEDSSIEGKQFSYGTLEIAESAEIFKIESYPIGEFQLIVSDDASKAYQMSAWVSVSE